MPLFSKFRNNGPSFEELLMPQLAQLHRLAYHYTGQQCDAEDLVQELLLKLYPRLKELQRVEKLRPWLAKALYRLFIDHWRRQQRQATDSTDPAILDSESIPAQAEVTTVTERLMLIRDLQAALVHLSDEQRILIIMHDVEAYTLVELETILDTPLGTLKSRLHRSRAKLRKLLSNDGTFSEQTACL